MKQAKDLRTYAFEEFKEEKGTYLWLLGATFLVIISVLIIFYSGHNAAPAEEVETEKNLLWILFIIVIAIFLGVWKLMEFSDDPNYLKCYVKGYEEYLESLEEQAEDLEKAKRYLEK